MSEAPLALRYTREHEWVAKTDTPSLVRIGITDFAQSALGDIVYVQLPAVGDEVSEGKVFGEVESTKSVSELYAPLTGKVTNVNAALSANPEILNSDPYGQGWIIEVEVTGGEESLLSAQEYVQLTA
ncbi:MAG: glycine cleavage system protein GcvH [Candidatus Nanopelagicaceae bacterium]|nr:glycine cleavage system protein GcvH [Candidatus Nanopelagicaceae bacterium]